MTQSNSFDKARIIASYLRPANENVAAARVLRASGNRISAYTLEQAAENILLALCASGGIHIPRPKSHQLDENVEHLSDNHPLKPSLRSIGFLTGYATTYRYPTESGRIVDDMQAERFNFALKVVETTLERAANHFQVSGLDIKAKEPAKNVGVMRNPTPVQASSESKVDDPPSGTSFGKK